MNEPVDEARWHRLHQLLDECLDLCADARAARLAELAREDAALATQLKRLLDADARAGLLDGNVGQVAPSIVRALAQSQVPAPSGSRRRIGHYRLIERIGQGGMGEVWRGEREDDFEQAVAIKLIRPLLDSPHLRERFARERRILARLEHPCIARLLDGGIAEDGTPWYAMEFVRGQDIVRHAEAASLGARARVELALQLCDAVAHAQAHLVVHRDLKPSNVLVDESGRVRVLDFGIARLIDDSADVGLTATGVRLFSPAYAAPEQIRGQIVGTAADVFSLGAVLHELLTGKPPYPARSAAPDRLIAGLAEETAPRPSQALRTASHTGITARELQGDLDTIVATSLQPDPARRYAGAAQLADDLRRWLDGRPIAARPDTAGYRFSRFVARHRLVVGSAVAVLLALVAGLGMALWQADVAREEARRAERTWGFVRSLFDDLSPTRARGEMSVDALLREGLSRMDAELEDVPDIHTALRGTFAKALAALGHSAESVPQLERVVREQEVLPAMRHALAVTLGDLAIAYKETARLPEAEAATRRALALFESLPGDHRAEALPPRTVLANILTTQRRGDEAIVQHELILADRRSLPGTAPIDLAVDYNNLAAAYLAADRYAEAERRYRELDQLLATDPAAPPSRRVYSLAGLANALYKLGRYDETLATIKEMRAVGERTLGPGHPVLLSSDNALRARIAQARGDFAAADALFAHVIGYLNARNIGPVELSWSFNHIAQGRDTDAAALLEKAIAHLDAAQGEDSTHALLARSALATLRARRDPAALPAAEAALARFDATGQTRNDEFPRAALLLAETLHQTGRSDDARALRQRAVAALDELFDASHPLVVQARATLD